VRVQKKKKKGSWKGMRLADEKAEQGGGGNVTKVAGMHFPNLSKGITNRKIHQSNFKGLLLNSEGVTSSKWKS